MQQGLFYLVDLDTAIPKLRLRLPHMILHWVAALKPQVLAMALFRQSAIIKSSRYQAVLAEAQRKLQLWAIVRGRLDCNGFAHAVMTWHEKRNGLSVSDFSWVFALLEGCYFVHPSLVSASAELGVEPDIYYFAQQYLPDL